MANQGRSFTDNQLIKILRLLAWTDLTINQIAERMGCSRSAVVGINRRHGIREYSGQRNHWTVKPDKKEEFRTRAS